MKMEPNNGRRGAAQKRVLLIVGALTILSLFAAPARTEDAELSRGKYLVTFGGCTDCHTPGHFLGKPDVARFLAGSDVGFSIPGLGVFVGRNLTSDKETGLGSWTREQIVTAITTGKRPDGRVLAPVMPWRGYAQLTRTDALAIAAYLQSLSPVRHDVPGPFGPNEEVPVFVMDVLPANVHNGLQQSPNGQPAPTQSR